MLADASDWKWQRNSECGKKITILADAALTMPGGIGKNCRDVGSPIVKALLGRDVVPDDSVYTTGTIGLLARVRRRRQWKVATHY